MSFSLSQKTILITGSTSGLGYKLALSLASQQANIIIHGRDSSKVDQVVSELKNINPSGNFSGIVCDLINIDQINKSFSEIKNLDILVNNAGVWWEGNTTDISPEKIIELINVNLTSSILTVNALLPILKQSEFAQIVNVDSVAGIELPDGYYHTVYTASKYGLRGFSEALTREFNDQKLRVMAVYPGGMETGIFDKAGNDYQPHEPWMFDPQETVDAIVFMLTRDPKINVKRLDIINHLQK